MRKILLVFCLFAFSVSLWAENDNEKFTSMAVKFINANRNIEVCKQLTDNKYQSRLKREKQERSCVYGCHIRIRVYAI